MNTSSNRRQFLKTAALTAGGLGGIAPLLNLQAQTEVSAARVTIDSADVCVVGAGYAGLSAAWALHKAGYSVIVLEAADRIGGRVWPQKFSDGTALDRGAGWVCTAQTDIMGLIKELGLKTYLQYDKGANVFVREDGKVFPYREIPEIAEAVGIEAMADLGLAMATVESLAAQVNVNQVWENLPLSGLFPGRTTYDADMMTISSWMEANMVTATGKQIFSGLLSGIGCTPNSVSFLHLLFQVATTPRKMFSDLYGSGVGQAENMRIVGGSGAVGAAIAARLGDSIVVGAPVDQIIQDSAGATVIAGERQVRARRVVMAIPTATAGYIDFEPNLTPDRIQLQQRAPAASGWKIWLAYDEAFWRKPKPGLPQGLTGESFAPNSYFTISIDAGLQEGRDNPGILNIFALGDSARKLARMDAVTRRKLAINEMVRRFGSQAANLSKTILSPDGEPYVETNWSDQRWVGGAYAAYPGPGVYSGYGFGPAIRGPQGRIHFAGVDSATRWYGTMDGAVQTGARAAREVVAALKAG